MHKSPEPWSPLHQTTSPAQRLPLPPSPSVLAHRRRRLLRSATNQLPSAAHSSPMSVLPHLPAAAGHRVSPGSAPPCSKMEPRTHATAPRPPPTAVSAPRQPPLPPAARRRRQGLPTPPGCAASGKLEEEPQEGPGAPATPESGAERPGGLPSQHGPGRERRREGARDGSPPVRKARVTPAASPLSRYNFSLFFPFPLCCRTAIVNRY
jgi:hypothetical protein